MARRSSLRSQLYRAARDVGNVQAAEKGPGSYAKRVVRRKCIGPRTGMTRHLLRGFGLLIPVVLLGGRRAGPVPLGRNPDAVADPKFDGVSSTGSIGHFHRRHPSSRKGRRQKSLSCRPDFEGGGIRHQGEGGCLWPRLTGGLCPGTAKSSGGFWTPPMPHLRLHGQPVGTGRRCLRRLPQPLPGGGGDGQPHRRRDRGVVRPRRYRERL